MLTSSVADFVIPASFPLYIHSLPSGVIECVGRRLLRCRRTGQTPHRQRSGGRLRTPWAWVYRRNLDPNRESLADLRIGIANAPNSSFPWFTVEAVRRERNGGSLCRRLVSTYANVGVGGGGHHARGRRGCAPS